MTWTELGFTAVEEYEGEAIYHGTSFRRFNQGSQLIIAQRIFHEDPNNAEWTIEVYGMDSRDDETLETTICGNPDHCELCNTEADAMARCKDLSESTLTL